MTRWDGAAPQPDPGRLTTCGVSWRRGPVRCPRGRGEIRMMLACALAAPFRHASRGLVWTLCGALVVMVTPAYAQDGSFLSGSLQLHYRSVGTGPPVIILSGGPGFEV